MAEALVVRRLIKPFPTIDYPQLESLRPVRTAHALISGTFGTVPRLPPSPFSFGHGEERRLAVGRATAGSFSGFGVTGPSRYSKPSLARPSSSLITITRTWPPDFKWPNRDSTAVGF